MITSSNVQKYEPQSEERPDLVLDYELMQQSIAIRRQRDRETRIAIVLLVTLVVVPLLGLSIYHNLYEVHHMDVISHIFN